MVQATGIKKAVTKMSRRLQASKIESPTAAQANLAEWQGELSVSGKLCDSSCYLTVCSLCGAGAFHSEAQLCSTV